MTKRRGRVPPWTPLVAAVLIGMGGYALMIRPARQEIQALERQLASLRVQEAQATQRLAEDARVERVSLPVSATALDRLWPELAQQAGTRGYTVDLLSFSPGVSGQARTVAVTVHLKGPYLALDDTVSMVEKLLPLWTWRTIEIANPEDRRGVDVTAVGVLPLAGGPARSAPSRPLPPHQPPEGPGMPPPPPSPGPGGRS